MGAPDSRGGAAPGGSALQRPCLRNDMAIADRSLVACMVAHAVVLSSLMHRSSPCRLDHGCSGAG